MTAGPLSLVSIASFDETPQISEPAPDRVVNGRPVHRTWLYHQDPSSQFFVGKWACDSGAWRVVYTEHEYCEMLEGSIRISDDAGGNRVVVAGDRFVVPAGFRGIWEILEPASKIFVVYEPRS